VVHAQARHLPKFDIQLVGDEQSADIRVSHTHDHGVVNAEVSCVHGLYWTGDPGSGEYSDYHRKANTRIIASVRRARAVTVPSEWVAEPFRRDMRLRPEVIGHGLELDEWTPGDSHGYLLYNKNRESDVCRSVWAWELASRGVTTVSTFEPAGKRRPPELTVIGTQSAEKMRQTIRGAGLYLATTKETFGIGTLEALAVGCPVLGFDWGGTADLVRHKENGYLVAPGDLDGLLEGVAYIRAHRREMALAARASAQAFTWARACEKYAALFHRLASEPEPDGVAVVITNHNYARFLGECLESVVKQSYRVDEIIVVDDGSTDDSLAVAREWAGRDERVSVQAQPNQGVAAARNNGVALTAQPFVVCLDADDKLDPRYIDACRSEMRRDRGLGLTWTGLTVLKGEQRAITNWGAGKFDWEWQATPGNPPRTNVPTGAMFRRSLWERGGGYRQEHAPGEDAEFYTRGLSVGFTARPATDLPFFLYREHGGGAHAKLPYKPIDTWLPWMRDREYPLGAPAEQAPDVRSYSDPKVSVIIPVGPGHARYLPDALDSLLGQNMRAWEVIVVWDDEINGPIENQSAELNDIPDLRRFPFIRSYSTSKWGAGPGAARNVGLQHAKAPLVLFLDADDMLAPGALAAMCAKYAEAGGRYVYGDWQAMPSPNSRDSSRSVAYPEYNAKEWLDFSGLGGKHNITVLMATDDARRIGFDETLPAWEDWDFFAHAAVDGVHGARVDRVTLYYRARAGSRTDHALNWGNGIDALKELKRKWGGKEPGMPCGGGCGGAGKAVMAAKDAWNGIPAERGTSGLSVRRVLTGRGGTMSENDTNVQPVRMEFVGLRAGSVAYPGLRGSGRKYRGGNNTIDKFKNVHPADVDTLLASGDWRRVGPPIATEPVQPPVKVEPEPVKQAAHVSAVGEAVEVGTTASEGGEEHLPGQRPPESWDNSQLNTIVEPVAVVQTAEGPVKRKRATAKKKTSKQSELKDLPPLDKA